MQISIDIPDSVRAQLEAEWGDLPRAAKEALAIESYRSGKISLGFLAKMLGMGVIEADQWLGKRGVPLHYSPDDLEKDRHNLAEHFPELRR